MLHYKKYLTECRFIEKGEARAGHKFWEIRGGVSAKIAFVDKGALRNISLCEVRFSAPPSV